MTFACFFEQQAIRVRPPQHEFEAARRGSPQTDAFLHLLDLPHAVTIPFRREPTQAESARKLIPVQVLMNTGLGAAAAEIAADENEISLDNVDAEPGETETSTAPAAAGNESGIEAEDENEIDIDI